MCDYSLAHIPNRLAVEGEQLVVHRFETHTLGLTPAHRRLWDILLHPNPPAVCVPPGPVSGCGTFHKPCSEAKASLRKKK